MRSHAEPVPGFLQVPWRGVGEAARDRDPQDCRRDIREIFIVNLFLAIGERHHLAVDPVQILAAEHQSDLFAPARHGMPAGPGRVWLGARPRPPAA